MPPTRLRPADESRRWRASIEPPEHRSLLRGSRVSRRQDRSLASARRMVRWAHDRLLPRLAARTARFTLGIPRNIAVSPDGSKVWYIRTPDGVTRTGQLWEHDVATGTETVLVDPAALLGDDGEELSAEERARRERSRESGAGLVDFTVDDTGRWAAFALSGQALGRPPRRPSRHRAPDRRRRDRPARRPHRASRRLRVRRRAARRGHHGTRRARRSSSPSRPPRCGGAPSSSPPRSWTASAGSGGRRTARRCWSSGTTRRRCTSGTSPIRSIPTAQPAAQRYPAAGTPNADVTLWHVGLDGSRTEVAWDRDAFEYLGRRRWTPARRPGDPGDEPRPATGPGPGRRRRPPARTSVLRELVDDAWVEVAGPPRFAEGGRLVALEDVDGMATSRRRRRTGQRRRPGRCAAS